MHKYIENKYDLSSTRDLLIVKLSGQCHRGSDIGTTDVVYMPLGFYNDGICKRLH